MCNTHDRSRHRLAVHRELYLESQVIQQLVDRSPSPTSGYDFVSKGNSRGYQRPERVSRRTKISKPKAGKSPRNRRIAVSLLACYGDDIQPFRKSAGLAGLYTNHKRICNGCACTLRSICSPSCHLPLKQPCALRALVFGPMPPELFPPIS